MPSPNSNDLNNFKASGEPPQQLTGASESVVGPTPLYRSAGAFVNSGSNATPGAPTGLATNDIEFLICETMDQAVTLTTANGFAAVSASPVSVPSGTATIATRGTLFWRRYAGQGNPVTNSPGDHIMARRFAFSGCDTVGEPWDFIQVSSEAVEDTSGSATGGTTLDPNRLIVVIIGSSKPDTNNTAAVNAWANASLTSITERGDNAGNQGNGGHIGCACGEKATQGVVSTTTYTKAAAGYKWHYVIALKPPTFSGARSLAQIGVG